MEKTNYQNILPSFIIFYFILFYLSAHFAFVHFSFPFMSQILIPATAEQSELSQVIIKTFPDVLTIFESRSSFSETRGVIDLNELSSSGPLRSEMNAKYLCIAAFAGVLRHCEAQGLLIAPHTLFVDYQPMDRHMLIDAGISIFSEIIMINLLFCLLHFIYRILFITFYLAINTLINE